jgi:hypothetical protein
MAVMKKLLTLCGIRPRAYVLRHDGPKVTYRWPCGYERTEALKDKMTGRPVGAYAADFYARYWREGQGVAYECPRCRRRAAKEATS